MNESVFVARPCSHNIFKSGAAAEASLFNMFIGPP